MSDYNSQALPEHVLKRMNPADRPRGVAGMLRVEIDEKNDKKTEKEIQSQISGLLRIREIVFYQSRMDKKPTVAIGLPDFAFTYHSIPIALEVKTSIGKLTEEQTETHKNMRANGWKVFVVRSVQEAKTVLDSISTSQASLPSASSCPL